MYMKQCFLEESELLTESDALLPATQLQSGTALRGLCSSGDGSFRVVIVNQARVLPARERDIVRISMEVPPGWAAGHVCEISVTSDHRVLVDRSDGLSWRCLDAREVSAGMSMLLSINEHPVEAVVSQVAQRVRSCLVVEAVLDDPCATILMGCSGSVSGSSSPLAVVFGSSPMPAVRLISRRSFLQLETCAIGSEGKAASDSVLVKRNREGSIYRTVRPPHDSSCRAWCRYHFQGKCRHGKLCSRCHHPDHYVGRTVAPRRRGHHGR